MRLGAPTAGVRRCAEVRIARAIAGQHGATHAWTEIYLPGAGWHGFDPTNNKLADSQHIAVAVAVAVTREQEKAAPLSGSWSGPADAFQRMHVSVQVVELEGAGTPDAGDAGA